MPDWPFGDLKPYTYHLQVIDPPWPWKVYSAKGGKKSPEAHYKTMTLDAIAALPVLELAASPCLLLLWGTIPMLPKQLAIMRAWGFVYKSALVWHKTTKNDRNSVGPGHRVRSMAELVLVGTLGSPQHKALPGLFRGERREHSRKPETFYEIVDRCCPDLAPRCDLFARERREGWDAFGDQLGLFNNPDEEAA